MRCPYCATEIADAAYVCPQCRRDLYLLKPMLDKIGALEADVAAKAKSVQSYEARVSALEKEVADLRGVTPAAPAAGAPMEEDAEAPTPGYAWNLLKALLPAVLVLVLAHWVLLFLYDTKPLYLRVASMIIPLPFAFLLHSAYPTRLWLSAAAGFAMALVAVLCMLVVTASIDKVPVLPQSARDMREVLEYMASIGLAFLTGLLLAEAVAWRRAMQKPPRIVVAIAKALTPDEEGQFGIERAAKRVDKLMKAATPAATGAASVYAGIKALLDNLG